MAISKCTYTSNVFNIDYCGKNGIKNNGMLWRYYEGDNELTGHTIAVI